MPGQRMAGHLGNVTTSTIKIEVVSGDAEKNLIYLAGAVPGPRGGLVTIFETVTAVVLSFAQATAVMTAAMAARRMRRCCMRGVLEGGCATCMHPAAQSATTGGRLVNRDCAAHIRV